MSPHNPSDLWLPIEQAVSYAAALAGSDLPTIWLERHVSSRTYTLMTKINSEVRPFDQLDLPDAVHRFLTHKGVLEWGQYIQDIVQSHIDDVSWNVDRVPEHKVLRSKERRIPSLLWSQQDQLRALYWERVSDVTQEPSGRSVDQWARKLKELFSAPHSKSSEDQAFEIVKKIMARRPDWEIQNQQSWRAWAWQDDAWSKVLENWGISTRVSHQGVPFPLWAIDSNWAQGLLSWMREAGVSAQFVPRHEDIPSPWFEGAPEEDLVGSLWHWAARMSTPNVLEQLLIQDPSLRDLQDINGNTAFHWACSGANEDVVNWLMACGARADQENNEGLLASEILPEGFDGLFEQMEEYRSSMSNNSAPDP